MNHWLSKLARPFVLALIEDKSTPLNFLYFSTQLSLKILAKQSKTSKKMLALTVELFNLAKARDFPQSASVFQGCNVYVPRQVRRINASLKAL